MLLYANAMRSYRMGWVSHCVVGQAPVSDYAKINDYANTFSSMPANSRLSFTNNVNYTVNSRALRECGYGNITIAVIIICMHMSLNLSLCDE